LENSIWDSESLMHCFSAMHRIGWLQKSRVVLLGSAPNNVSIGVKIRSSVLETESKISAFDVDIPQFSGQLSQARYDRFWRRSQWVDATPALILSAAVSIRPVRRHLVINRR